MVHGNCGISIYRPDSAAGVRARSKAVVEQPTVMITTPCGHLNVETEAKAGVEFLPKFANKRSPESVLTAMRGCHSASPLSVQTQLKCALRLSFKF